MTSRGSIYWADLGQARGIKPARRRPVLVIQANPFNASRLNTTIAAVITSNTTLAAMPGNVFLPAVASGLPKDSVVNITALVTLGKTDLDESAGQLPTSLMNEVDRGLHRVLGLLLQRPRSGMIRCLERTNAQYPPFGIVSGVECLAANEAHIRVSGHHHFL